MCVELSLQNADGRESAIRKICHHERRGLGARDLTLAFFLRVVILSAARVRASGSREVEGPAMATAKPGAAIGFLRLGLKSSLRMTDGKIGSLHFVKKRREPLFPKVRSQVCRGITLGPARIFF